VRLYKELSEVERAFADLKDVLDMRPIYHQTDNRVQAHIYVSSISISVTAPRSVTAGTHRAATVPLASIKSIRPPRQNRVRPSCSDKPHFWS
jgi:hypothetical protein